MLILNEYSRYCNGIAPLYFTIVNVGQFWKHHKDKLSDFTSCYNRLAYYYFMQE